MLGCLKLHFSICANQRLVQERMRIFSTIAKQVRLSGRLGWFDPSSVDIRHLGFLAETCMCKVIGPRDLEFSHWSLFGTLHWIVVSQLAPRLHAPNSQILLESFVQFSQAVSMHQSCWHPVDVLRLYMLLHWSYVDQWTFICCHWVFWYQAIVERLCIGDLNLVHNALGFVGWFIGEELSQEGIQVGLPCQ